MSAAIAPPTADEALQAEIIAHALHLAGTNSPVAFQLRLALLLESALQLKQHRT